MAPPCTIDDVWIPTQAGTTGASWFRGPGSDRATTGVLLVPGIIHEQQTMAVGLVALARDLATYGLPTMLVDLAGTAQGSGRLTDPGVGDRWDDDIRSAVRHMRESGLQHIVVIGVRLGALLAAHATVDDPVDLLVMWSPVLSGRRYTRELQMMQAATNDSSAAPGVTVAGFHVPPDLVAHLKGLDAGKLDGKPAAALCFVDVEERLADLLTGSPFAEELPVEGVVATETINWLFTDASEFPAPFGDIARVRRHLLGVAAHFGPEPEGSFAPDLAGLDTHVIEHDGVAIRERRVAFGGRRGIISEPVGEVDRRVAYVAVTTVGPGRIFVDLARREAAAGRVTLRFDLGGFGTSDRPSADAWAEFYHPSASGDIDAAVDLLVAEGHGPVRVVGFCAGAWSALEARPRPEVSGIVAINPQLLVRSRVVHRRGAPDQSAVAGFMARMAVHPLVSRAVEKVERENPVPSPAVRWVGRHAAAGTAVTLVWDEDDLGLTYYRARADRRGGVRRRGPRPDVRVYPGLGHLPSGAAREQLLADLHDLA